MSERVAIFGVTTDIGADLARLYAERRARLYLVGSDASKLAGLVVELQPHIASSALELSLRDGVAQSVVQHAATALGSIDLAVLVEDASENASGSLRTLAAELARRGVRTHLVTRTEAARGANSYPMFSRASKAALRVVAQVDRAATVESTRPGSTLSALLGAPAWLLQLSRAAVLRAP